MSAIVSPITQRTTRAAAPEPVWISPEQACAKVPGLTLEILSNHRKKGTGPRYYKPSQKTVIYEEHEFDAWVASTVSDTRT